MAKKKTKTAIRTLNKKMVKIVVIVAAAALLFSAGLAYITGGFLPPTAGSNNASTISELEYQISQLETSLETSPDNSSLLTQLGNSYYQLGIIYNEMEEFEKSEESFASAVDPYGLALEAEPDNVNVRVDRAVSAFYSDNYDLAQEQFEKAIETDPTHVQAHYNYGIFQLYGRNDAAGAIENFNEVIELNPADQPQMVANARNLITQAEAQMNELIGDPNQFLDNDDVDEETAEDNETDEN